MSAIGYLSLRRTEDAIEVLERAHTLAPEDGAIRLALGSAWLERNRLTGVAEYAGTALDKTEEARVVLGDTSEVLFNRALALAALGRMDDAIEAWRDYLRVDPTSEWAAEARDRLRLLEQQRGSSALTTMEDAQRIGLAALATREPWLLLDLLDNHLIPRWIDAPPLDERAHLDDIIIVADALASAGRDRFALACFSALSRMSSSERRSGAGAFQQLNQARVAFDASDYREAERLATDAATRMRTLGLPSQDAEIFAAFSHFFQEDQARAVQMADATVRRSSGQGFFRLEGRAAYMRGLHLSGLSDFSKSVAQLEDALGLFERSGDRGQVAATHSQLLGVHSETGMTALAWSHSVSSVRSLYPGVRQRLRYLVLSNAQFFLIQSDLLFAASTLSRPLQHLAEESGNAAFAADEALVQAGLWQRVDNTSAVRATTAVARRHVADLASQETRAQYEMALLLLEGRAYARTSPHEAIDALNSVIAQLAERGRLVALAEARLWLGRALLAIGDTAGAENAWLEGVAALASERTVETDSGVTAHRTDRLWELHGELISLHRDSPEESLLALERARANALTTAAAERPVPWTSLSEDVALLAYAVLPDDMAVWLVTAAGPQVVFRPLPRGGIAKEVDLLLSSAHSSGAVVDTAELSRLLLPAGGLPNGFSRLAVLADGPLHLVPFDLLVDESGVQLGRRFEITRVASVAGATSDIRAAVGEQLRPLLVGYGGPQPKHGLHALPAVDDEVRSIHRIYHERGSILLDSRATIGKLKEMLPEYNLLHIAGHAIPGGPETPDATIFLAPELDAGVLTAAEVSTLRLQPGTIVILSACSTAAGSSLRGKGLIGIAEPFIEAGASAVLASLWPVTDSDAAAAMADLHGRLLGGATLQEALATSVRSTLTTSPADWQPWVVIGPYARIQTRGN
ncbi:MAG: CHAT domain-containing protein [Vicinamibacterales bacterium]